jgi:hypothetical protein
VGAAALSDSVADATASLADSEADSTASVAEASASEALSDALSDASEAVLVGEEVVEDSLSVSVSVEVLLVSVEFWPTSGRLPPQKLWAKARVSVHHGTIMLVFFGFSDSGSGFGLDLRWMSASLQAPGAEMQLWTPERKFSLEQMQAESVTVQPVEVMLVRAQEVAHSGSWDRSWAATRPSRAATMKDFIVTVC